MKRNNGQIQVKGKAIEALCRRIAAVVFLAFALAGCGYTTRSLIVDRYKTIYIPPFVNKISITDVSDAGNKYRINKPMLETDITKSVINKFLIDGNLRPVDSESADLILTGELVEFRRDPLRYTDSDEVEEYRLNLVVNLKIFDTKENKTVWEEMGFTGDTTYFTRGIAAKSEDTAVKDALSDLSRRIVERTVEVW